MSITAFNAARRRKAALKAAQGQEAQGQEVTASEAPANEEAAQGQEEDEEPARNGGRKK